MYTHTHEHTEKNNGISLEKKKKKQQNETISEACGAADLAITYIFLGRECNNIIKVKGSRVVNPKACWLTKFQISFVSIYH